MASTESSVFQALVVATIPADNHRMVQEGFQYPSACPFHMLNDAAPPLWQMKKWPTTVFLHGLYWYYALAVAAEWSVWCWAYWDPGQPNQGELTDACAEMTAAMPAPQSLLRMGRLGNQLQSQQWAAIDAKKWLLGYNGGFPILLMGSRVLHSYWVSRLATQLPWKHRQAQQAACSTVLYGATAVRATPRGTLQINGVTTTCHSLACVVTDNVCCLLSCRVCYAASAAIYGIIVLVLLASPKGSPPPPSPVVSLRDC